jgi:glucose/arabinose dehydrogenase
MSLLCSMIQNFRSSPSRPCRPVAVTVVMGAWMTLLLLTLSAPPGLIASASAQAAAKEDDYYRIESLPIPEGVVLEVGALELLPDGRLAVSSRRGEIWMVDKPHAAKTADMKFTRFAEGLHEVLGLAWRDGWLYVTQRCEVSRLKDSDGDGRADLFETISDGWEINGDYHEYAFGSKFDKDGNLWVVLCLTGSFNSEVKFRGWCLRVSADGKVIPTTSGIRSPGGIGVNAAGDMFYTDNQGPWNGTSSLKHLSPGTFVGHPAGNRWYDLAPEMGKRPQEPLSGSRMMVEAGKIPELVPPAVYFPYQKMGQSASGIAADMTKGKFGPFAGQLFVGDQTHSTVMRVCLEKVRGRYQGACIPFKAGFGSGTLAMLLSSEGSMFVGGTNRGWGSRGSKPFALERLTWTGKTPFEIHEMRAKPDGFEVTFTEKVDRKSAADPSSYRLETYTYIYQASYGSPEVDQTTPKVTRVEVGADGLSARLYIDQLQVGHVHQLHLDGVRSEAMQPLLHPIAYYTLNYIP